MTRPPERVDHDDVADVVVVGTGAGGAPLVAELARHGLRVVALEAGRSFEPDDYSPDEDLASDIIWMDERLSGGSDPTAFGPNNSGKGVGGSMLHWGAFLPRPDPRDLTLRGESGVGHDWPISFDELLDFVRRVEAVIGTSGPANYPWTPDRTFTSPAPPRNASADALVRGCAALGIRAADAPAGLVTRDHDQPHHGQRGGCVSCGSCHQGCRNGAKSGVDNTYLPLAAAHGADIRDGATVFDIETGPKGRVTAVVYRRHGQNHRQRCANLVLAAGGVETPRLLLHTGIGNTSGQVGRNFLAHEATQVWATFDTEMRSYRGYPSSAITEDFVRPIDADFAGGYLIQSLGVMPATLATTLVRGAGLWGRKLVDTLDGYRFLGGAGINGECLPSDANTLELADEVDHLGVPKARVTFSADANSTALRRHAVDTMTRILEAAGGTGAFPVSRTAHTLGTCRMGTDPATSVVDPVGRSHDIANLWISDGSVFPSSLCANPALPIMALSLRTAAALRRSSMS